MLGNDVLTLVPGRLGGVGDWGVEGRGRLDDVLAEAGEAPIADRTAVLAVGSNASPAQLHRKFTRAGVSPVVPITAVTVEGIAAGLSAYVSRPGYIPAAPVLAPGHAAALHVTWLDDAGLAAVDATEPNYRRVRLPPRHQVRSALGRPVHGCWIYVSRHGYLAGPDGRPRRLTDQGTVLRQVISGLPDLGITTLDEWFAAAKDETWRNSVRKRFRAAGMTRSQPALASWR